MCDPIGYYYVGIIIIYNIKIINNEQHLVIHHCYPSNNNKIGDSIKPFVTNVPCNLIILTLILYIKLEV